MRSLLPLSDGVLYSHWTEALELEWPYPNFDPVELACRRSGEFYHHARSFVAIQRARTIANAAIWVNSAHRNWLHNIAVGGAPRSCHLFVAFDISTRGHDLRTLYFALKAAGFKGFGFYETFIHVDLGRARFWFGSDKAHEIWAPIMAARPVDVPL